MQGRGDAREFPQHIFPGLAVGCRHKSATHAQWVVDAKMYKDKKELYCVSEAGAVSPFNLLKYITHLKRGKGPVTFTEREQPRDSRLLAA